MSTMLLDLALKSVLVAAVGLAAAGLMRRRSAAARHFVLTLTMVCLLILPVVAIFAPRWSVPFLRRSSPAPSFAASTQNSQEELSVPSVNALRPRPSLPALPVAWILWSVVAGGCLLKLGVRLVRLRAMERRLQMSADPAVQTLVAKSCRESRRHVLLLEGASDEPPMTWGHFRPVMLLPLDAGRWQVARLESVVLHELAHVERGDWLACLGAQAACGLYWFNPLVWVIAARISVESELAADDRVIGQGFSPADYASNLLEVLRDIRRSRSAATAALAMARPGSLDGRVRAILEERRCRRPIRGAATLGIVGAAAVAVVTIGAAAPSVVSTAQEPVEFAQAPVVFSGELKQDSAKAARPRQQVAPANAPLPRQVVVTPKPAAASMPLASRAPRVARPASASANLDMPATPAPPRTHRNDDAVVFRADRKQLKKSGDGALADASAIGRHGQAGSARSDVSLDPIDPSASIGSIYRDTEKALARAKVEVAASLAKAKLELKNQGLPPEAQEAVRMSMELGSNTALETMQSLGPALQLKIAKLVQQAKTLKRTTKNDGLKDVRNLNSDAHQPSPP